MSKKTNHAPKKAHRVLKTVLKIVGGFFLFVLVTAGLLAGALYCGLQVLINGPSPTARDLFVRTVCETSAAGFLAEMFLTDEQIQTIVLGQGEAEYVETDTSLIQLPSNNPDTTEPSGGEDDADPWGLVDEDGDGIILERVTGEGFAGHLMIVLDPSRVIMGSVPDSYHVKGYTVEEMVEHFDGVAGINAGGFLDPNGSGNGSIPDTMVVYDGQVYCENYGTNMGFVGIDSNCIMHVATKITPAEIREKDIQ